VLQTNLGNDNNNKFYIIQVLQSSSGQYFTWNRWGRLGAEGQSALAPCGSYELAIKAFCKKFKDKTKNSWDERDNFVKYDKKYQLVETEGGDGDGACADSDSALGKLTESQINKGQDVLAEILAILESGSTSGCTELSGEYYSFIPTKFGMKQPPVIDNMELWEEKHSLLQLWLRMGFEELGPELQDNPLEGLEKLEIPTSLAACSTKISDKSSIDAATKKGQALAKTYAPKGKLAQEVWPAYYGAIVLYTGEMLHYHLQSPVIHCPSCLLTM
jgi:predicted DNA-binding WGR domain protein